MGRFMIKPLDAALWLVGLTCVIALFLAHEDPFARDWLCNRTGFCPSVANEKAWNKIIYDLAVGALVTLIFYWLVVRLPDRQKRARLRKSLAQQYRSYKRDSIALMLSVSDGLYDGEFPDRLLDRNEFKEYFKQQVGQGQDRWDSLFNKMDAYHFGELLRRMEMFRDEIAFVLNNVDIPGDKAFDFLKRLSRAIYRMNGLTAEYDDKEVLFRLLWEIFTGWSFVTGYQKRDIIEDTIDAI